MKSRTGIGIDIHPLVAGRPLVLGGVSIPFEKGVEGYSDGDVLIHAIIDALLGASGLGDIGTHFPSNDPKYKEVSSVVLMNETLHLLSEHGWRPLYVDATIMAERPMVRPYFYRIRKTLSESMRLDVSGINVKATTTDGLGLIGRGEGIGGLAVTTVEELS